MIKILGSQYRLLYDNGACRREHRRGSSNGAYLEIIIDPEFPPDSQQETLIHEIIEMICDQTDMSGINHQCISTLSCVLHQVIRDNPEVFTLTMPEADK